MNIAKKLGKIFPNGFNIFFSTSLGVYILKVFNFARYQQGVNS